jgi:hypothetical protein
VPALVPLPLRKPPDRVLILYLLLAHSAAAGEVPAAAAHNLHLFLVQQQRVYARAAAVGDRRKPPPPSVVFVAVGVAPASAGWRPAAWWRPAGSNATASATSPDSSAPSLAAAQALTTACGGSVPLGLCLVVHAGAPGEAPAVAAALRGLAPARGLAGLARLFTAVMVVTDEVRGPFVPPYLRAADPSWQWWSPMVQRLMRGVGGVHLVAAALGPVRGGVQHNASIALEPGAFALSFPFGVGAVVEMASEAEASWALSSAAAPGAGPAVSPSPTLALDACRFVAGGHGKGHVSALLARTMAVGGHLGAVGGRTRAAADPGLWPFGSVGGEDGTSAAAAVHACVHWPTRVQAPSSLDGAGWATRDARVTGDSLSGYASLFVRTLTAAGLGVEHRQVSHETNVLLGARCHALRGGRGPMGDCRGCEMQPVGGVPPEAWARHLPKPYTKNGVNWLLGRDIQGRLHAAAAAALARASAAASPVPAPSGASPLQLLSAAGARSDLQVSQALPGLVEARRNPQGLYDVLAALNLLPVGVPRLAPDGWFSHPVDTLPGTAPAAGPPGSRNQAVLGDVGAVPRRHLIMYVFAGVTEEALENFRYFLEFGLLPGAEDADFVVIMVDVGDAARPGPLPVDITKRLSAAKLAGTDKHRRVCCACARTGVPVVRRFCRCHAR